MTKFHLCNNSGICPIDSVIPGKSSCAFQFRRENKMGHSYDLLHFSSAFVFNQSVDSHKYVNSVRHTKYNITIS